MIMILLIRLGYYVRRPLTSIDFTALNSSKIIGSSSSLNKGIHDRYVFEYLILIIWAFQLFNIRFLLSQVSIERKRRKLETAF